MLGTNLDLPFVLLEDTVHTISCMMCQDYTLQNSVRYQQK